MKKLNYGYAAIKNDTAYCKLDEIYQAEVKSLSNEFKQWIRSIKIIT